MKVDGKAMKVECVVICVNYGDFLAWTLPTDKQNFNKVVVVTTPEDVRTQKLCEYWHIQCIQTNVFTSDGSKFNKGLGINEGLKALDGDGWVVHKDADIFLPPLFRNTIEKMELDPEGIYHIDRLMCPDFQSWIEFYCAPKIVQEANIYVHLRPFPMGVRISKHEYGGWTPIGYFQMWNQGKKKLIYPKQHGDAGRSDVLFTTDNFKRPHRHMLAEMVVVHLETPIPSGTQMGANWFGRKTPPFGPVENTLPTEVKALPPSGIQYSCPTKSVK